MPAPSEVLINQTTTALPNWAAVVTAALLALTVYRITVLGDRRGTSTAANWYAFFITCYALTRFSVIQEWLSGVTGASLSDVRVLGSAADVAAALALLLLAFRWRSATGLTPPLLRAVFVTFGLLACCALFALNAPAHTANIAIEEVGGWRTAAYITLYSGIFIPAEALIVVTLLQMARHGTSDWRRRVLVTFLLLAIAVSVASLSTRIAGAWLAAIGIDTGLHSARTSLANDIAFYPSVVWLIPVGLPAVVVDIRRRLGLAESRISRSIRHVRPLWKSLVDVAPSAVLADESGVENEVEVNHRMQVEISDVIARVAAYLPPGTQWPDDPRGQARTLVAACKSYISDNGPERAPDPPTWAKDETAVEAVADVWSKEGLDQQVRALTTLGPGDENAQSRSAM